MCTVDFSDTAAWWDYAPDRVEVAPEGAPHPSRSMSAQIDLTVSGPWGTRMHACIFSFVFIFHPNQPRRSFQTRLVDSSFWGGQKRKKRSFPLVTWKLSPIKIALLFLASFFSFVLFIWIICHKTRPVWLVGWLIYWFVDCLSRKNKYMGTTRYTSNIYSIQYGWSSSTCLCPFVSICGSKAVQQEDRYRANRCR